jgi:hydroxymethylpyrimidine pyrophosphatase-like HAD family hydrolase
MAQRRKISLVLADVDGTLVNEQKVLTERAQKAVRALHTAGIRFAITSGRPPRGMAMLFEPPQLDTPIAAFNGGLFVKSDFSILEKKTLPADVAHEAIGLMHKRGLDAWVYSGNDWLITKPDAPHVAREAWTVKFQPKIVATNKNANKGAVVEYLSQHVGVPEQEIATIGDQPNDVLMFKRSGFCIAMGNASDEVKAQATATTDSYNDEGFAKAMERFILGSAA